MEILGSMTTETPKTAAASYGIDEGIGMFGDLSQTRTLQLSHDFCTVPMLGLGVTKLSKFGLYIQKKRYSGPMKTDAGSVRFCHVKVAMELLPEYP